MEIAVRKLIGFAALADVFEYRAANARATTTADRSILIRNASSQGGGERAVLRG
jgi:hypothetical protein